MKTLKLVKGDSISLEFDIDTDITNWKIRAQISDNHSHCIKLATSNVTGGSIDQIDITNTGIEKSTFLLSTPKTKTACFEDEARLEIEVETGILVGNEPEKKTVLQAKILFEEEDIDWEEVS